MAKEVAKSPLTCATVEILISSSRQTADRCICPLLVAPAAVCTFRAPYESRWCRPPPRVCAVLQPLETHRRSVSYDIAELRRDLHVFGPRGCRHESRRGWLDRLRKVPAPWPRRAVHQNPQCSVLYRFDRTTAAPKRPRNIQFRCRPHGIAWKDLPSDTLRVSLPPGLFECALSLRINTRQPVGATAAH